MNRFQVSLVISLFFVVAGLFSGCAMSDHPLEQGTPNNFGGYTTGDSARAESKTGSGTTGPVSTPTSPPAPIPGQGVDAGTPTQPPPTTPDEPDPSTQVPVVNPWEDPAKDNLSTFAIDVDTASYTYVRRLLKAGTRPMPSDIRVEEFINYFDYQYDGPKTKPFEVYADGAISPYNPKHSLLRVGIQGRRMTQEERRTMHLTFLVDTSCSMGGATRIGLVKKSLLILLEQLRADDTVAIATYAGSTQKLLDPTPASKLDVIRDVINRLTTGGGTAMGSGMTLAYDMASQTFVKGHENRVIVLSDGDANIGRTSHEEILKSIEQYLAKGITMSTIGFGMGNYRATRMEQLANQGDGNNYYIDSEDQALRVFRDKFINNMITIAKDVKVQVEFNKDYVTRYRLIGYENRAIADKDFRNDKVDAGELGAGHTVTAIYEVELKREEVAPLIASQSQTPLITIRLRYKGPDAVKDDPASEIVAPVPPLFLHRPFESTPSAFRWASAVMGFAEILRKSPLAEGWTYDHVLAVGQGAAVSSDPSHQEFLELVGIAKGLK